MARFSLRHILGPRLPLDLRACPACRADALHPVKWDREEDPLWRV